MIKLFIAVLTAMLGLYAEHALGSSVTPIEALFRGFLKGPLMTPVASKSNQFSGRTLLASGSASQVVSTSTVGSDSLILTQVLCALPSGYNTQGLISITSGNQTGVASSSAVFSGQVINLSPQGVNPYQGTTRVQSIFDGGAFTVAISSATTTSGCNIGWHIPSAEPCAVKVNSISPGGNFTLGWADQKPRPIDVTVLWEIRKTS